jgi:hypothetical protein
MRFLYLLTFLLASFLTYSQENNTGVENIRHIVEQVNQDSEYVKRVLNNEEFMEEATDGGGELTGYFKNGHLVKIMEWIGLSSCISVTEYYIQSHKLIFAYTQEKDFAYNANLNSFDSQKQVVTMECRFYFENDKLIKNIIKGESRCGGMPSKDWAKNYLDDCSRYEKLLKSK